MPFVRISLPGVYSRTQSVGEKVVVLFLLLLLSLSFCFLPVCSAHRYREFGWDSPAPTKLQYVYTNACTIDIIRVTVVGAVSLAPSPECNKASQPTQPTTKKVSRRGDYYRKCQRISHKTWWGKTNNNSP